MWCLLVVRAPAAADFFNVLIVNTLDEMGDGHGHRLAEHKTRPRGCDIQFLLGPCDGDIAQPAFLFHFRFAVPGPESREKPFFRTNEKHGLELQTLRAVNRHQSDIVLIFLVLIHIGV